MNELNEIKLIYSGLIDGEFSKLKWVEICDLFIDKCLIHKVSIVRIG